VLLFSLVHESGHDVVHASATSQDDLRIWTFAKGADELTIEQWLEGDTVVVALTRSDEKGVETVRAYEFPDESAADEFHAGLNSSLLQFGWSFVGHLPERRMGLGPPNAGPPERSAAVVDGRRAHPRITLGLS
jgi:hypothetical protein